jgi:hypothetical protein
VPTGPLGFIARFFQCQGERLALRGLLGGSLLQRLPGSVDTSGSESLPHGRCDGTIPPQPAKRSARGGATVHTASSADIPGDPARGATRGDRELTTTPATTQHATAQGRPPLHGATSPFLGPVALSRQKLLGVQKVLPTPVPCVLVSPQNTPRRHRLFPTLALMRPPVDDHALGCRAARDQRASIGWMAQPLVETMPAGQAPEAIPAQGPWADLRQRQRRLTIPEPRLPGTAQCTPLLADAGNRVLPLAVSDLCEPIVTRADAPHGDCPHARAPLDFGFQGLPSALTHAAQRLFGPGALHPEDYTIMKLAWIIDAISIDEQRLGQRTQLEQMRPVTIVPGQP